MKSALLLIRVVLRLKRSIPPEMSELPFAHGKIFTWAPGKVAAIWTCLPRRWDGRALRAFQQARRWVEMPVVVRWRLGALVSIEMPPTRSSTKPC